MNSFSRYKWERISRDRTLCAMISVLTTLLAVLMTVSSCAIWPAILSLRAGGEASVVPACNAALLAALLLLAVALLVALVLAWFDKSYSFLKSFIVTFCAGWVVMVVVLFAVPVDLSGITTVNFAIQVLQCIVTFLLGAVLAFLPALLSSILAWVAREAYYVISEIHR